MRVAAVESPSALHRPLTSEAQPTIFVRLRALKKLSARDPLDLPASFAGVTAVFPVSSLAFIFFLSEGKLLDSSWCGDFSSRGSPGLSLLVRSAGPASFFRVIPRCGDRLPGRLVPVRAWLPDFAFALFCPQVHSSRNGTCACSAGNSRATSDGLTRRFPYGKPGTHCGAASSSCTATPAPRRL